jgi:hypothetical protein
MEIALPASQESVSLQLLSMNGHVPTIDHHLPPVICQMLSADWQPPSIDSHPKRSLTGALE